MELFLKINRDVSALVKFTTRSGLVFYAGTVEAHSEWDNIIRNVVFRPKQVNSFWSY